MEVESHFQTKQTNKNKIYHIICNKGQISRQELVYEVKLSLPTVVQSIVELMEEGLIYESGSQGNTGGRRAKIYSASPRARVSIGIDITRNHISLVVVDILGEIILHKRIRYSFSMETTYFKKLGLLVDESVKELSLTQKQILGVGIGVPGLITEDCQTVYYGTILNFTGITCQTFNKFIPYPCRLFNDANAGGFAESKLNKEITSAFYISLANNVGGSILINNKIFKGESSRSGEIGHMTIIPEGRPCYCGQKGCWEAYCAASILAEHTNGNLEEFFRLLEEKDESCVKEWKTYLEYLVIGVNNIRMLFGCKVILGGYVGAYMEKYIDKVRKMAIERNPFENDADYLLVCKYKTEAIATGAALPFVEDFVNSI
ncbi:MAG: ROK family transcriptional regulator [Lachnospiraceae bacterium]